MAGAPDHPREPERLAALRATGLLDSGSEAEFDDAVTAASALAGTPMALVSLVDAHRQWFKARRGIEARETPREQAFCAHAILDQEVPLIVPDAREDDRFKDNPLVCGVPNIAFYAGVPLVDPVTDMPLGTLCVLDTEPRELSREQVEGLQALARLLGSVVQLRQREGLLKMAIED